MAKGTGFRIQSSKQIKIRNLNRIREYFALIFITNLFVILVEFELISKFQLVAM